MKQNPRGNIDDTFARGQEKVALTLEWLARFHVSTLSIIARRLGINENTAWRFVKKLKDRELIRAVPVSTVRKEVFILTQPGLELCTELCGRIFVYSTEPSKINVNRVRHDLNVQMAVLKRLDPTTEFQFERDMSFTERKKLPDAIVVNNNKKFALEVELNPKTDERIYRGFLNHVKALMADKFYDHVEYIFKNDVMQNYYLARFNQESWPVHKWNGVVRKWELMQERFFPNEHDNLIHRFNFVVERMYEG